VLASPLSDYLTNLRISQMLIERKDFNSVSFGLSPVSNEYRFGCWAMGAIIILVGIIGGWREDARGPNSDS
jgi:hypothetical protein